MTTSASSRKALGGWCFSSQFPDSETMFDSKVGNLSHNHLSHYLRFSCLTPAT